MSALTERQALFEQGRRAREFAAEQSRTIARLKGELFQAERADKEALAQDIRHADKKHSKARDDAAAHKDQLAQRLAEAEENHAATTAAVNGVQSDLEALYITNFAEFSQEAESLTLAAHEALAALRPAYEAAAHAWAQAEAIWRPLAPAIKERLAEHENLIGVFPDPRTRNADAAVPRFPFPAGSGIFDGVEKGRLCARPAGLTIGDNREPEGEDVVTEPMLMFDSDLLRSTGRVTPPEAADADARTHQGLPVLFPGDPGWER